MAQRQQATTANEQLVQQMAEEAWNQGNLEIVDEYMTEETPVHLPGIEPFTGAEAYKEQIQRYHSAFPDFHVEITDLFSDDDHVVAQYVFTGTNEGPLESGPMPIPATGKEVEIDGIVVVHFEDGAPLSEYNRSDSLTMLDQLGLFG